MPVAPRIRRRLAVAVWAEEFEVFETVIETVAVDVVERHRQRAPTPFAQAADFTAVDLQPLDNETVFQVCAAPRLPGGEQLLVGCPLSTRNDRAALLRRIPRLMGEAEGSDAIANAVPLVVVPLD